MSKSSFKGKRAPTSPDKRQVGRDLKGRFVEGRTKAAASGKSSQDSIKRIVVRYGRAIKRLADR